MASMIPPHDSLVKYHSPVVVTTAARPEEGQEGPGDAEKASTQTEDILNYLTAARVDGRRHALGPVRVVDAGDAARCGQPAGRSTEAAAAPGPRDGHLSGPRGCTPVLRRSHRQVTINCAERGLLLLRVRDEVRMTIAAYQTLYESSIAFGMRKALTAEHTKAELNNKVRTLEAEREDLEGQVKELQERCESIKDREAKRREEDDAANAGGRTVQEDHRAAKANPGAMLSAPPRSHKRVSLLWRWSFAP